MIIEHKTSGGTWYEITGIDTDIDGEYSTLRQARKACRLVTSRYIEVVTVYA